MPRVSLRRRETFCASHRLMAKALSPQQNEALFGKCYRPHGHGHNYVLEVTVTGEVASDTGVVINLDDLKKLIQAHVMDKVDHRHLNHELQEFQELNPTVENIAVVIWGWLRPHLDSALELEVCVHETEKNLAIYRGN